MKILETSVLDTTVRAKALGQEGAKHVIERPVCPEQGEGQWGRRG